MALYVGPVLNIVTQRNERFRHRKGDPWQYRHAAAYAWKLSAKISFIIHSTPNQWINDLIPAVCLPALHTFSDPFQSSVKHLFIPNPFFALYPPFLLSPPVAPPVRLSVRPISLSPRRSPSYRRSAHFHTASWPLHYMLMNFSRGNLSGSIIRQHRIICSS